MPFTTVSAADIITKLNLQPHPEGGHYREVYRSTSMVFPNLKGNELGEKRSAMTSIFYLLEKGDFSAFHQVKSDEVWNLFLGGPLEIHQINNDRQYSKTILAQDFGSGYTPQQIIPAGTLQSARPCPGTEFVLCSCIVAPGFDFSDFYMPTRKEMLDLFPEYSEIVTQLTRS